MAEDKNKLIEYCERSGYSEQLIMLAVSIAVSLSKGKSRCELETLINLLDVVRDVMKSILAQRCIFEKDGINGFWGFF